MRLRFRHIKAWLLPAALLCLALSSCVYDDGMEPDTAGNPSDLMVSFTLRMERSRSGRETYSRGFPAEPDKDYDYDVYGPTWGDDYPQVEGNTFDNRLLKEHFHMLLLEKETNKVVGKMEHDKMDVLIYDPYEDYTIVKFWGVLDTNLSTEELSRDDKYKVMIFANGDNGCAAGLDETLAGDGITFSHIGQPGDRNSAGRAFDAIPMWGVAEAKLAGIKPGKQKEIGEVSMLRSMAKIVVDLDTDSKGDLTEDVKGVRLTSLSVSNVNTNGAMLPANWGTITDTKSLEIKNTLRIPTPEGTMKDFGSGLKVAVTAKDVTSIEFYVPEYDNNADAEFLLKVKYTVGDDTEEKEGEIHICKYENGQPAANYTLWPIVRNHIYQYTITKVGPTVDYLRFKVTIADMEKGGDYVFDYE